MADAGGWADLADRLEAAGRRDRALVAARTGLAALDRAGGDDHALEVARARVRGLTGPDVVPLHVDTAGGGDGPGAPAGEARASWVGAPAEGVLAMLGWVERAGALEVVRVVVPGTRRGRAAFVRLVAALPEDVAVEAVLPARDPAVLRACRRAGFEEVVGSFSARGHVGGSLRVRRGPGSPDGGAR